MGLIPIFATEYLRLSYSKVSHKLAVQFDRTLRGSRISRRVGVGLVGGGGRRLPRWLRFENFECRNERIWTLGGCAGHAPSRSANELADQCERTLRLIKCDLNFLGYLLNIFHYFHFHQHMIFDMALTVLFNTVY